MGSAHVDCTSWRHAGWRVSKPVPAPAHRTVDLSVTTHALVVASFSTVVVVQLMLPGCFSAQCSSTSSTDAVEVLADRSSVGARAVGAGPGATCCDRGNALLSGPLDEPARPSGAGAELELEERGAETLRHISVAAAKEA